MAAKKTAAKKTAPKKAKAANGKTKKAKPAKGATAAPGSASAGDGGLAAAVSEAMTTLRGVAKALAAYGLASLTPEERKHSRGRLRKNEDDAMVAVLDTVDSRPGLFAPLAPRDHGSDDALVETEPSRAALERRTALQPLGDLLQKLATQVSDDILSSAALAKDVTGPAYAIIQAHAPIDPELRRIAAPALGFYAKLGEKKKQTKLVAAAAKTAKAAEKAAAKVKKSAAAGGNGASPG